jgi:hypothetical protein
LTFTAGVVLAGSGCYLVVDKSGGAEGAAGIGGGCNFCGAGGDSFPTGSVPDPSGSGGTYPTPSVVVSGTGGVGGAGGRAAGPEAPLTRVVSPPAGCPSLTVSRFNELIFVDPLVTNDARADNQAAYRPWSFRQRLEALVPGSADGASALVGAWLDQWSTLTSVPESTDPAAALVSIQPRPAAGDTFVCPWLRTSPQTGCDSSCTSCNNRRVDLSRAPFRLLAIVNRADLAAGNGAASAVACGSSGGEMRFIYGAADPQTNGVLPFTVVFEYGITLQSGETLRDWAAVWHALAALPVSSPNFNAQLDAVLAQGLVRATLRRVLTNEVAFGLADGDPWEMRQFVPQLTDAGTMRLVEVAMNGTPRLTLAGSTELGQWIDANSATVLAGQNALPVTMLAASAPIPSADFAWQTSATDAATATAFNQNTCNGCHGGRTDPTDVPFQHVAPPATMSYYGGGPGAPSAARLSHFLNNPGHDDELGRRERLLAGYLCSSCGGGTGGIGGGGSGGGGAGGRVYSP